MKAKLPDVISKFILFLIGFTGVFLTLNTKLAAGLSGNSIPPKEQIDSVKAAMDECNTDTCRFVILRNMFWRYRFAGSRISSYYGKWAYETIKNSSDLMELSNGYDIKAIMLMEENKIDSAYYFYTKALNISKKINYYFRIAWSYNGLGEIATQRREYRKAIDNFLLSKKWFLTLKNPIFIPEWKINRLLADNYIKLNIYDSAITCLLVSSEISKKYSDTKAQIFIAMSIADCYKNQNNIKKTAEYLYKALKVAESIKDDEILSTIYRQIGDFFLDYKRNFGTARDYYNKSLELAKKHDFGKVVANLYGQIAKTYLEENNYNLAMEYNRKSLKISQDINYRHSLSDSYLHLGYAYKKLGENKLALENFLKCWDTQCDYCPPITFHEALVGIAEIYLKQNNFPEAIKWYEKSLEIADIVHAQIEIARSKFGIGDYYRKTNNAGLAEKNYLEALQIAKGAKNISLIKGIADSLSKFFALRNDYRSAMIYLQLAREMDDSLSRAEHQASMANLEMNFEFERLNKDNEAKALQSNEEIKRQRVFLYSLIVISLLLTGLGAVVFISYRRKKRDNQLLTYQKEEIAKKNQDIQAKVDEIIQQKNEIERISKQLHEADQMKLSFFTNVSHELRTPLTLIVSPLAKLIKNTQDEETLNLYRLMYRNSRRLQNLIDRLLDIAKLDKGELKLNLKKGSLNKLFRVISSMFQSISEEKNIEFSLIEKNENIVFPFDPERIELIINNLLSNAFKFTPDGGKITASIEVCNDGYNLNSSNEITGYAVIKVKDNGVGIPVESLDKVFERFYQCDSTITRNFEGSGIGLALTKELVELHQGKIIVRSELRKWTEFTVVLPMILDDEYQSIDDYTNVKGADEVIASGEFDNEENSSKQHDTVLIVEDNTDLRSYLKEIISKEFSVITACDGNAGIEAAVTNIPDIIISDVMMPGKDGYQLTHSLKENINTSHIPIILLTAKAGHDSKMKGLEKGADDYIIKPFNEEELILKIKNVLLTRQRLQEKHRKQIIVNPSEVDNISLDEQFLLNLVSAIEEEISNTDLDVDLLCSKVNLSRPQLYRKLKALTGLTITQFIRSIRLKRASQLLQKKAATVSEVAYMTGFENLSYFTKKFKEEFGVLPSEY